MIAALVPQPTPAEDEAVEDLRDLLDEVSALACVAAGYLDGGTPVPAGLVDAAGRAAVALHEALSRLADNA
jgi:hypothetical protein